MTIHGVQLAWVTGALTVLWYVLTCRAVVDTVAAEALTIRRRASKLRYLEGSESGAAMWVNNVAPAIAAAWLRGE
jgi:hypothetical protein